MSIVLDAVVTCVALRSQGGYAQSRPAHGDTSPGKGFPSRTQDSFVASGKCIVCGVCVRVCVCVCVVCVSSVELGKSHVFLPVGHHNRLRQCCVVRCSQVTRVAVAGRRRRARAKSRRRRRWTRSPASWCRTWRRPRTRTSSVSASPHVTRFGGTFDVAPRNITP